MRRWINFIQGGSPPLRWHGSREQKTWADEGVFLPPRHSGIDGLDNQTTLTYKGEILSAEFLRHSSQGFAICDTRSWVSFQLLFSKAQSTKLSGLTVSMLRVQGPNCLV